MVGKKNHAGAASSFGPPSLPSLKEQQWGALNTHTYTYMKIVEENEEEVEEDEEKRANNKRNVATTPQPRGATHTHKFTIAFIRPHLCVAVTSREPVKKKKRTLYISYIPRDSLQNTYRTRFKPKISLLYYLIIFYQIIISKHV